MNDTNISKVQKNTYFIKQLVVICILLFFVGCKSNEVKIYDALKTINIYSASGQTLNAYDIIDNKLKKTIYLVNVDCPHCIGPFFDAKIDIKESLFIFSAYSFNKFHKNSLINKIIWSNDYYIDNEYKLMDEIIRISKKKKGSLVLKQHIVLKLNSI